MTDFIQGNGKLFDICAAFILPNAMGTSISSQIDGGGWCAGSTTEAPKTII